MSSAVEVVHLVRPGDQSVVPRPYWLFCTLDRSIPLHQSNQESSIFGLYPLFRFPPVQRLSKAPRRHRLAKSCSHDARSAELYQGRFHHTSRVIFLQRRDREWGTRIQCAQYRASGSLVQLLLHCPQYAHELCSLCCLLLTRHEFALVGQRSLSSRHWQLKIFARSLGSCPRYFVVKPEPLVSPKALHQHRMR